MPLRAFCFTVHNMLTKRDYTYSIDDLFDLIIAICVGVWTYCILTWMNIDAKPSHDGGDGAKGFSVKGEFKHYVYIAIEKTGAKDFNTIMFLACMVFVMWGRFVVMLQLTRTFGPMLRIIINMLGEISKFLSIYFICLCILASFSSLMFG